MTRPCDLGVGCDEYGVCYAAAHGQPDRCGRPDDEPEPTDAEKLAAEAVTRLFEARL